MNKSGELLSKYVNRARTAEFVAVISLCTALNGIRLGWAVFASSAIIAATQEYQAFHQRNIISSTFEKSKLIKIKRDGNT